MLSLVDVSCEQFNHRMICLFPPHTVMNVLFAVAYYTVAPRRWKREAFSSFHLSDLRWDCWFCWLIDIRFQHFTEFLVSKIRRDWGFDPYRPLYPAPCKPVTQKHQCMWTNILLKNLYCPLPTGVWCTETWGWCLWQPVLTSGDSPQAEQLNLVPVGSLCLALFGTHEVFFFPSQCAALVH